MLSKPIKKLYIELVSDYANIFIEPYFVHKCWFGSILISYVGYYEFCQE